MMDDAYYMNIALQLAEAVQAQTSPNPPVGAVIVKSGAIVGMGAHLQSGEAHAEVVALNMAQERAKEATMYVTLEPCSHTGKTPPCVEAIKKSKVKRVVVATIDPHEKVDGRGIAMLQEAGVEVTVGVLQERADRLYQVFFHYIKQRYPYVTLKTAMTLDGKIASSTGDSKWITGATARLDGHRYRHQHDAILVGVGTVLADNPRLTSRLLHGNNPLRIILDTNLRTPIDAFVVTDEAAPTWIFVGADVALSRIEAYEQQEQVQIIQLPVAQVEIESVLTYLGEKSITSVYVEGGAQIHGAFLQEGLVDQYVTYIAPKLIGGQTAKTAMEGKGVAEVVDALKLTIKTVEMIGEDIKIVGRKEG